MKLELQGRNICPFWIICRQSGLDDDCALEAKPHLSLYYLAVQLEFRPDARSDMSTLICVMRCPGRGNYQKANGIKLNFIIVRSYSFVRVKDP